MPAKKRITAGVDAVQSKLTGANLKDPVWIDPPSWQPLSTPITPAMISFMAKPGHRIPGEAEIAEHAQQLEAERMERLVARGGPQAERAWRLAHVRTMLASGHATDAEVRRWQEAGLINDAREVLRDDGTAFERVPRREERAIPAPVEPYDLPRVEHGNDLEADARERSIAEAAQRPAQLYDPYGIDR